ncbi:peptidase inhibitor family I36 protein [Streptomyces sp. ODS28]|uniref:peptidase inhibitor family I36 protein n=1 Tax=Streptomyces sp. ODS28 TaxID=3136688 RepID=UPI0031EACC3F
MRHTWRLPSVLAVTALALTGPMAAGDTAFAQPVVSSTPAASTTSGPASSSPTQPGTPKAQGTCNRSKFCAWPKTYYRGRGITAISTRGCLNTDFTAHSVKNYTGFYVLLYPKANCKGHPKKIPGNFKWGESKTFKSFRAKK